MRCGATLIALAAVVLLGPGCRKASPPTSNTPIKVNMPIVLRNEQSSAQAKSVRLILDNGNVTCRTIAGAGARVYWEALWPIGVEPEGLEVRVTELGNTLLVEDEWTGPKDGLRPKVTITVSAFERTDIDCTLGSGSFDSALSGTTKLHLGSGTATLRGAPVGTAAHVGTGDLTAQLVLHGGSHTLDVGTGNLEVELGAGTSAAIAATTGTGDITATGIEGATEGALTARTFAGKLGAGKAQLKATVGTGAVTLRALPQE
jgi:hypothetical protein